jgi:hypothetical protein
LAGLLTVIAQKVHLNAEVKADVRSVADVIELGPQAKLGAALSYASAAELLKAPGVVVAGTVTREERSTGHDGMRGNRAERDHDRDWSMRMHPGDPGWRVVCLTSSRCASSSAAATTTTTTVRSSHVVC